MLSLSLMYWRLLVNSNHLSEVGSVVEMVRGSWPNAFRKMRNEKRKKAEVDFIEIIAIAMRALR